MPLPENAGTFVTDQLLPLATPAQLRAVVAAYQRNAPRAWLSLTAWCAGTAPSMPLAEIARRISKNAAKAFRTADTTIDPAVIEFLGGVDPELTQPEALAALTAAAPVLLVVAPVLHAQANIARNRVGLAMLLSRALEDLPRSTWAHATPEALAGSYGLRLDPAHRVVVEPMLKLQRERLQANLARVIIRLRGDQPVNLLGLVDALLADLGALSVQHNHVRAAVAEG